MSAYKGMNPKHDRLLIRPKDKEEVTRGGIVIPDMAKERPNEGEVLACGPGRLTDEGKYMPMSVAVGDHVLFGKYDGTDIEVDGESLMIVRESEIIAVVEPEPAD